MSLFKLAIYGGIGYMVYQTFFAEMPASGMQRGSAGSSRREGTPRGQQSRSSAGQFMSRGGDGTPVSTQEPSGASAQHRVGRGVVS